MRRSLLPAAARGFSLIEMMVALVLGAIVVAGMVSLFSSSRQSYQVQSGDNLLQQNLRFAEDRLGWSLRMADFWGGDSISANNLTVDSTASNVVTALGKCNGAWATAVNPATTGGGGVYGYDGASAFPFDTTCIGGSANYAPGSPVLVVRYADPQMLPPGPAVSGFAPAESSTISGSPSQVFVLSVPASSAQLFAGTPPSTNSPGLHRYAYAYHVDMYYLQPCDVYVSGSTCSASADGGHPLPTLMRLSLQSDGTLKSEPVVDGIEQLDFEYGVVVDPSGAQLTPTYKSATDVTSANLWSKVISVRVSMVAVNPNRDIKVPHVQTFALGTLGNCTYTINNASNPTVTGCTSLVPYGDNPWQYTRAMQSFVVQLRNQIRS
ncbi:PilW family protein [Dyella telluris]|uniref:PilW family protein n=1 Tax=Dyella telluris TaxID=2763498 RepID=A0A7G8Q130_9GAMM|nr:PilW family protein [Dyella telluris]QNK00488.1 PilW family protein [Dyella telluris]